MFKKITALFLAVSLIFSLLIGCSSKPQNQESTEITTNIDTQNGKVKIVFWHTFGGRNGEALERLKDAYNASQDAVELELQYQGTYDDAITKLRATQKGSGPDIMLLYDIGTRWMIDSGYALKMQDFINADNYDISDYEKNILAYYTLNNELYSMPFNSSSPVIVYNVEALDKAGLDPKTAFVDLDACMETANALSASGTKVGGTIANYSWIFEQMIGIQAQDFLDNGNGRTDRATKTVIGENGSALKLLTKWNEFASLDSTQTYGKGTADAKAQFTTGSLGFMVDSCAVYENISDSAGGKFSVGFAPLPKVSKDDKGGTSVGGGSLWIMDNGSSNKAAAAWDFIKFATQAEQQAQWAAGTGYIPIRTSSLETETYKNYMQNINPAIIVAIESLQNSTPDNTGGVMGVFPQARVIIENEVEMMINDPSYTPEQAVEKIVAKINDEIELYNRTNG